MNCVLAIRFKLGITLMKGNQLYLFGCRSEEFGKTSKCLVVFYQHQKVSTIQKRIADKVRWPVAHSKINFLEIGFMPRKAACLSAIVKQIVDMPVPMSQAKRSVQETRGIHINSFRYFARGLQCTHTHLWLLPPPLRALPRLGENIRASREQKGKEKRAMDFEVRPTVTL